MSTPAPGRWGIVRILFAMAVVLYVDRINITVAAPALARELSLDPAALGRVFGAFLIGYAVGLAPGGYLADRVGAYRLLAAAGSLWGLVTLLTGLIPAGSAHAVPFLFAARLALGLCEACAFPTFNRAIANWMQPGERASASGWVHCGAGVGGAVTPLLIASLVAKAGWRASFLVSGALTLAITAWWALAASEAPATAAATARALPDKAWFRRAARSPEAWLLCASEFFYGIAGFVYLSWFYTYFVQIRGIEILRAAVLASLPYLAIAIGAPLGGMLCDRAASRLSPPWGRRVVPFSGLLLAAVCAVAAPRIGADGLAAAVFACAAGFQYVAAPGYWSALIDVTRTGAGILGGLMNSFSYFGSALATVLFPFLAARIGWEASIQLSGAAACLAGLIWLGIRSQRQIDAA